MAFDLFAFFIMLAVLFLFSFGLRFKKRYLPPQLFFSDLTVLKRETATWRTQLQKLPLLLIGIALGSWLLAFSDPHFLVAKKHNPGRMALYLVLDQSGSMQEVVQTRDIEGRRIEIPKIQLEKKITQAFVKGDPRIHLAGRPDDMIGLVAFARTARVLTPLTLNHAAVMAQLEKLDVEKNKEEDGTAIGYALYKTANLIAATQSYARTGIGSDQPSHSMQNATIILITDGFHDPSILDAENSLRTIDPLEAAKDAKEKKVRIYIINIDPSMGSDKFIAERHLMQEVADITGGKYFLMNQTTDLGQIFEKIEAAEKTHLGSSESLQALNKELYQKIPLYPYLIGIGLLALLCGIFLESTLLRRIP